MGKTGGYRCTRNGEHALEVLSADNSIDIVMSDINMPVMDGLDFLRQLRAQNLAVGIPVVMITTESSAEHVKQARAHARIWFCIDTLEYLRRGGRIGKAQAWLGGTLKIKPILTLQREITPIERVRTSKRAFERMVEYGQKLVDEGLTAWAVQHIQAPDEAQRLVSRCRELIGSEPLFISEVGPVIGTYTGPGLLGVGGIDPSLLA